MLYAQENPIETIRQMQLDFGWKTFREKIADNRHYKTIDDGKSIERYNEEGKLIYTLKNTGNGIKTKFKDCNLKETIQGLEDCANSRNYVHQDCAHKSKTLEGALKMLKAKIISGNEQEICSVHIDGNEQSQEWIEENTNKIKEKLTADEKVRMQRNKTNNQTTKLFSKKAGQSSIITTFHDTMRSYVSVSGGTQIINTNHQFINTTNHRSLAA